MNMFKPTGAKSVSAYINSVPEERREVIRFIHDFIKKTVPGLKPHFAYNMLGYGSFPYKNYKGEMVAWPIIALANQKQYVSVYVCALDGKQYLAEKHKKDLGKVSVGRSCIRFKKIEDVNLPALKKVLKQAAITPGLISVAKKKKTKK